MSHVDSHAGEASSSKFADSETPLRADGNGNGNGANGATAAGFVAQAKMTVEPPRETDLQQSYAKVVGSEANPKGWYGSMSTCPPMTDGSKRGRRTSC